MASVDRWGPESARARRLWSSRTGDRWRPHRRWALAVCWLCYLSLDLAIELVYPWDCLLFEAGLLALLLPVVDPLPALTATAQPLPVVVLAYQVLLVRVLWGFGKFKFMGMTRKDSGYLREFLITQPMPTKLGWWAHHLPLPIHRAALLLLFLVEVPLPVLAFVPGPGRLVLAVAATAVMLGIQLTGNFGFFNVLLIVLLVPLLDIGNSFSLAIAGPQTSSSMCWSWSGLLAAYWHFRSTAGCPTPGCTGQRT